MAIETATGVLSLTSGGSVGSTFSVTGLPFQPKALIVWWSGRTEAVDAIGAHTLLENRQGWGFATGASNRFCLGNSFNRKTARTDALVATVSNISVSDGRIDFSSFNSDGFTLIIDDALPVALRLSWLALGGADLTNALASSFTLDAGTGDLDISGVTFQPDTVFFISPNATSSETFTGDMHLGFAAGASPENIVWSGHDNVFSYCKSGECIATVEVGGSIIGRAAVSLWQSDGFRLNRIESIGTARTVYYLALKGGRYKASSFATRTDGNDITITPGLTTKALFALSACRAESTADTSTANTEISIGAFTSTSSRNVQGIFHDGTDSQTIIEYDAFYAHIDTTPAIVGLCDVTAVSTSVTAVMDDPDDTAKFVGYWAIGEASIQTIAVDRALESDTAQALTAAKIVVLALASETDLAQTITVVTAHLIVVALESDSAQAFTILKTTDVAQALETDLAQVISRQLGLVQVGEIDLAQPITLNQAKRIEIGQASEICWALPFILGIRPCFEVDTAHALVVVLGDGAVPARPVYLDSAVVIEVGVPTQVVTGLGHLEGQSVCVVVDGRIQDSATYVVMSAQITLLVIAQRKIEVGLCYDGQLWTMRPGIKDQMVEGLPRHWVKLGFDVDDSYGGFVKTGNSTDEMPFYEGDRSYPIQPSATFTQLFTGEVLAQHYGETELDGRVKVRVPTPGPFTLLAIYGDIEFGDRA